MFWPKAMDLFLSIASFLALDVVTDTKVACFVSDFGYFARIKVAVAGPLAIALIFVLVSILWAACACCSGKKTRNAAHRASRFHSDNAVVRGFWAAVHPILFFVDLVHPIVTRTLLQFGTCRDLGSAGRWLEADYSIRCYTDDYNTYAGAAWFAGVLYAVGVPAVFMLLINKFKHHGRRGDKLVQKALGPS